MNIQYVQTINDNNSTLKMSGSTKTVSRFISNDSWAMEFNDNEIMRADDVLDLTCSANPNLVIRIKTNSKCRNDRLQKKLKRARQRKQQISFGGNGCIHPLM